MFGSVVRDLSVGELMTLREEGLSNAEIAERLDVSLNTVYRLIGKQGPGIRKTYTRKAAGPAVKPVVAALPVKPVGLPVEKPAERPVEAPAGPAVRSGDNGFLPVIRRSVDLQGYACVYHITGDTVELKDGLLTGILDRDMVGRLGKELLKVWRVMGEEAEKCCSTTST